MTARLRGKVWYADFMIDGKREREPFDTEEEAKAWEEEYRFRHKRGEPPPPPPKNKRTDTGKKLETLEEMFEHVKKTQWATMDSSRHLIKNGKDMVTKLGPKTLLTSISKADLDNAYAEFIDDDGFTIGTANRKMSAISKILTAAFDNGIISRKPKIPHQEESEGRVRYIDVEEEILITGLFAQWGQFWMVDLTTVLIETGMRLGEAIRVEWRDITPDGKRLHIWKTKNKKSRTITLSKRAREAFDRLKQTERKDLDGPFVNEAPTGTLRSLWKRMQGHFREEGQEEGEGRFDDVTPHIMRHTCATRMCNMPGVNLQYVQKFLGHKNLKTTMRYAHLANTSLDHCADALDAYYEQGIRAMKDKREEQGAQPQ